jgi:eukaryotic-like serine/threonine-protein kinase
MSEAAKQWEGQIVEGTFPLRQYLGGTDHSAVFLTEFGEGVPQKAAIKLYPADPATADLQLSSWESAAQLSHPNLLQLHRSGRCRIDGNDLLYLVMEYAEEDLSQILPQRALSTEETRDMLGPVLDALQYLHGKGFVHGDLKPANILASGDHLKLSSDAISRIGEALSGLRRAGVYDPPEAVSGSGKPAGDVWSLGTALVEVLTQKLPEWQPGPHREPVVPANIPSPFQEIARECLRLEPDRRISIAEIGARLNPRSVAASASASSAAPVSSLGVSPAAGVAPKMPLVTPKVAMALPVPPHSAARMQNNPHRPPPYRESGGRPRFLVPLILVALLVTAILTVPRLLTHRPEAQTAATVSSEKPSSQPAAQKPARSAAVSKPKAVSETEPKVSETTRSAAPDVAQANQKLAEPAAPESLKATSEKVQPPDRTPTPASSVAADSVKPASGGMGSSKGEVLDQVVPDVSGKARATIHGKVRVSVRVHVDPSGGVSEAEFDSPGPSKFFADLAMQAARKWAFTPPEVNGKSVASEWRIKFEFTQKDTKVIPTQTAP